LKAWVAVPGLLYLDYGIVGITVAVMAAGLCRNGERGRLANLLPPVAVPGAYLIEGPPIKAVTPAILVPVLLKISLFELKSSFEVTCPWNNSDAD
jgi:hypothetical protein